MNVEFVSMTTPDVESKLLPRIRVIVFAVCAGLTFIQLLREQAGPRAFLFFVLVALILYLTPTGEFLGHRWRLAARVTLVAGVASLVFGLISSANRVPMRDSASANFIGVGKRKHRLSALALWPGTR